jgi:hypothetical protein
MSDTTEKGAIPAAVDWVSLEEAPKHPQVSQLIPTQRAWYWELGKPGFKRRMVEAGALIKIGKCWRVSLERAPVVIEEIYREASLAALDRTSSAPKRNRRGTRTLDTGAART